MPQIFDVIEHVSLALVLYRALGTRSKGRDSACSPARALENPRRIEFRRVTFHRTNSSSGRSTLDPEQRKLFDTECIASSALLGPFYGWRRWHLGICLVVVALRDSMEKVASERKTNPHRPANPRFRVTCEFHR